MASADLIERLAQHLTLGESPREELAWLAAHGELRHVERGELLTRTADLWDKLVIVLSGVQAIYVDRARPS